MPTSVYFGITVRYESDGKVITMEITVWKLLKGKMHTADKAREIRMW